MKVNSMFVCILTMLALGAATFTANADELDRRLEASAYKTIEACNGGGGCAAAQAENKAIYQQWSQKTMQMQSMSQQDQRTVRDEQLRQDVRRRGW